MTEITTKNRVTFLLALINQIEKMAHNEIEVELFARFYHEGIFDGKYDDCGNTEEQAKIITENDYLWFFSVIGEDDEKYEAVKSSYIRNGLGEYESEEESEITEIVAEYNGNFLVCLM